MALKVGLVACCLNTEHIRGMGKYVFELVKQSGSQRDVEWCLFGDNPNRPMTLPAHDQLTTDVFTFRGDRFHFWEQLGLPIHAIKNDVSVLHCTEGTMSWWQPRPTVVTIHDTLSWRERPDTAIAKAYYETVLPAAIDKCAAVITISESSRNDILARWPGIEGKLTVIPHGIEDAYFTSDYGQVPADLAQQLDGAAYLVYLGGPLERKRFSWAVEVLAKCANKRLKLVACGFGAEARKTAPDRLSHEMRGRVLFAEFLSDSELRALYRGAQAVLYPTLYEGFGFPAIEAQAAGVPVIFSALGSLKELIGPLALVVPPNELDAWVNAVGEATSMGARRLVLSEQAAAWVRQFSWRESFERHFAVYKLAALTKA